MIGYSNPEETAKILRQHDDGKIWVHTGDYGCMNENGELTILSRGFTERYGGGCLFVVPMENRVVDIDGIEDSVFVLVPDKAHEGYFLPYLYIILEEGVFLQDVEPAIYKVLQPHEYPVRISIIKERKYFQFKTNRKQIVAEILNEHNSNS